MTLHPWLASQDRTVWHETPGSHPQPYFSNQVSSTTTCILLADEFRSSSSSKQYILCSRNPMNSDFILFDDGGCLKTCVGSLWCASSLESKGYTHQAISERIEVKCLSFSFSFVNDSLLFTSDGRRCPTEADLMVNISWFRMKLYTRKNRRAYMCPCAIASKSKAIPRSHEPQIHNTIQTNPCTHQASPKAPKTSLEKPWSSTSHSPAPTGKHNENGLSAFALGLSVKQLEFDFCSQSPLLLLRRAWTFWR